MLFVGKYCTTCSAVGVYRVRPGHEHRARLLFFLFILLLLLLLLLFQTVLPGVNLLHVVRVRRGGGPVALHHADGAAAADVADLDTKE